MKTNVFTILGVAVFFLIVASVIFSFVKSDSGEIGIANSTIKSYDPITKTATLNSVEDDTIAIVQLKSNLNEQVGLGYQKVFEYEIDSKTNYDNFIQEIEIYNIKNGNTKENKQIDLKYLTYEEYEVNDYEESCSLNKNGTNECTNKIIGTHKEQQEVWNDLSSMNVKAEKIVISGWTDVKQGDNYEWIPNFAGTKVNEWATWTGNLSVGIIFYYRLDETTGTNVVNTVGVNGTIISAMSQLGSVGIIGTAYTTNSSSLANSNIAQENTALGNITYAFWMNTTVAGTAGSPIFAGGTSGNFGHYVDMDAGKLSIDIYNGTAYVCGGSRNMKPAVNFNDGVRRFILFTTNATHCNLYVDGVLNVSKATNNVVRSGGNWQIGWGGTATSEVTIDELAVWNRSLTQAEITLLYNDGNGCSYGDENCYTIPASTNCNFTGYVKDSAGNGLNGANVIIINQTDNKMYYNVTSDANGFWSKNITNSNGTSSSQLYTVLAYFNNSLVGGIKPYVNSTCP